MQANAQVRRGALGRTRTCNLLIRSQMLYPLSYERGQCRPPAGTSLGPVDPRRLRDLNPGWA